MIKNKVVSILHNKVSSKYKFLLYKQGGLFIWPALFLFQSLGLFYKNRQSFLLLAEYKYCGRSQNLQYSSFSKMIFECLILLFLLLAPLTGFSKDKGVSVLMIAQPGGKETDQFDCRSKIYVDLFLSESPEKHRKLSAFWYNPAGQQQEYTKYEFIGNRVWLWLELHPSFGGKLFSGIDPSAGMSDFIGKWEVKLYLDEVFLERKVFYVVC